MRQTAYLRERYANLANYFGVLLRVIGVVFVVPCLTVIFFPDNLSLLSPFLIVALVMFSLGWILSKTIPSTEDDSLAFTEGALLITAIWVTAILAGTIPFIWINEMTFIQALFESTSGWTSTGLTIVDVLQSSEIILVYRSVIQFVGGAGLAIIAISAIAGPLGYSFSIAEGRTEKLAPQVRRSAGIVLSLYSGYAVVGALALRIAGMSWFDAVNHSLTAVSTGGFSTRPESIGFWDSAAVEAVVIVLMILGNINFLTIYTIITGKWRVLFKVGEMRLMAALMLGSTILLVTAVSSQFYADIPKAIRVGLFESVSAVSTAGFTTTSYSDWPPVGWLCLILVMVAGGGSGSTAGAIKLSRVNIMLRAIGWQFKRAFLPSGTVNSPKIWQGNSQETLSDSKVSQVALYIGLYLICFWIGSVILALSGYSLEESLFEMASSVGTVGLSAGVTSPDAPPQVLLVQTAAMLLGRLEFYVVIIGGLKIVRDATILTKSTTSH